MPFSDYIVYVDESGDHSLRNINPQNPVFALAFCIFEKAQYRQAVVPLVQALKFDFWGHDGIVLHSYEIRNQRNDFRILVDQTLRGLFLQRINDIIDAIPMTVIASAIHKPNHVQQYAYPADPYKISLQFCVERLQRFLQERNQLGGTTHLLVERRGKPEDDALELEFRRICDGASYAGQITNLDIRFMDKKHNSTGLQIADLVAYPINRHVMNPAQPNQAYDVVQQKFRRSAGGVVMGYGLKIFP